MRFYYYITLLVIGFHNLTYAYDADAVRAQLERDHTDTSVYRVTEIIDGDTVKLENGKEVRLVGLQAPKISLGRRDFKEWPLGYEAKEALSELALNKDVSLYYGGREMDRYGRLLAHLFLDNGTWVQGEMLKMGMARVYSFADNRSIVQEMLDVENQARESMRGIWDLNFYKIKRQEDSGKHTNSFQLVSGRILEVATVRSNTYLNFGEDYKTDFTIVVPGKVRRMFDKKDINLSDFEGKNIIVRGWLKYYNGPSIDITHPEQLVIDKMER